MCERHIMLLCHFLFWVLPFFLSFFLLLLLLVCSNAGMAMSNFFENCYWRIKGISYLLKFYVDSKEVFLHPWTTWFVSSTNSCCSFKPADLHACTWWQALSVLWLWCRWYSHSLTVACQFLLLLFVLLFRPKIFFLNKRDKKRGKR